MPLKGHPRPIIIAADLPPGERWGHLFLSQETNMPWTKDHLGRYQNGPYRIEPYYLRDDAGEYYHGGYMILELTPEDRCDTFLAQATRPSETYAHFERLSFCEPICDLLLQWAKEDDDKQFPRTQH
jgi:hypothetical protein